MTPRAHARLAQSVERQALNLMVVGSSPTVGVFLYNYSDTCLERTIKGLRQRQDSNLRGQSPMDF